MYKVKSLDHCFLLFFSDVLLDGGDELSPLDAAEEHHLGGGVHQGKPRSFLFSLRISRSSVKVIPYQMYLMSFTMKSSTKKL